jgi:hypothetical protein
MVGSAKSKVEQLEEQLKSARVDFEATQEATHKGINFQFCFYDIN